MTARGRTVKVFTEKIESGKSQRVPDEVIVEEPISIRLDGELIGTTLSLIHISEPTRPY